MGLILKVISRNSLMLRTIFDHLHDGSLRVTPTKIRIKIDPIALKFHVENGAMPRVKCKNCKNLSFWAHIIVIGERGLFKTQEVHITIVLLSSKEGAKNVQKLFTWFMDGSFSKK